MAQPKNMTSPFEKMQRKVSGSSVGKFPLDVTNGLTQLENYMNVPISSLVPFTLKGDGDFKPYPQEKFGHNCKTS